MGEMIDLVKSKPCIHIDSEEFPELKKAKIGQKFNLYTKVKVISLSKNSCDKKGIISGTLEIQEIEDEDFGYKNYTDIVNENIETEGEE